jgi:starvation-inducible DNA-binding protein
MPKTRNTLAESIRKKMVPVLNARLADSVDLMLQAKQAHWNVRGATFSQLHELFDKVADSAGEWADMLAERAVQLGGTAEGTAAAVAKATTLKPYPLTITAGEAHVEALAKALADFGTKVRTAIDATGQAGDADTADLFTEISRDVDKYLWQVEAHLG